MTVELKFKEKGQKEGWEDIPAIVQVGENETAKGVEWIRRMFKCVEIRWNHAGSLQGYYVTGNVSRY